MLKNEWTIINSYTLPGGVFSHHPPWCSKPPHFLKIINGLRALVGPGDEGLIATDGSGWVLAQISYDIMSCQRNQIFTSQLASLSDPWSSTSGCPESSNNDNYPWGLFLSYYCHECRLGGSHPLTSRNIKKWGCSPSNLQVHSELLLHSHFRKQAR